MKNQALSAGFFTIVKSCAVLAAVVALLGACTSGSAPGSGDVLDQAERAQSVQVEATLRSVAAAQQQVHASSGSYTTDLTVLTKAGYNGSGGVTVAIARADAGGFCAEARHVGVEGTWHVTESETAVAEGPC